MQPDAVPARGGTLMSVVLEGTLLPGTTPLARFVPMEGEREDEDEEKGEGPGTASEPCAPRPSTVPTKSLPPYTAYSRPVSPARWTPPPAA